MIDVLVSFFSLSSFNVFILKKRPFLLAVVNLLVVVVLGFVSEMKTGFCCI